ncbi:hypothetical protein [Bacillus sp. Marseille-P3661]|uniref:hypothetical protein n=1 Tax=Bacillus sp. Marseille-P3661 TaxID=1936234 RepID=UPI000C858C8F|nr:hypothetical protein [Bacillus sp. Marseille-P3661]
MFYSYWHHPNRQHLPMQPAQPVQPSLPQTGHSQLGALTSYLQQLLPIITHPISQGGGYYAPQVPIGVNPSIELAKKQRQTYINLYLENNANFNHWVSQPVNIINASQQAEWNAKYLQFLDLENMYKSLIKQTEAFLAQMGSPVTPYFSS